MDVIDYRGCMGVINHCGCMGVIVRSLLVYGCDSKIIMAVWV